MGKNVSSIAKGTSPQSQLSLAVFALSTAASSLDKLFLTYKYDGREIVDQGAQIRALKNKLEELDKKVTGIISPHILYSTGLDGQHQTAFKSFSTREVLNSEKIREFFGKKIGPYLSVINITSVTYRPRA